MGDAENSFQPSKKRAAGRELSRDNPGLDDDDEVGTSEQEMGTFKKASDEVLAGRRIVRVRRNQPSSAPSSNPFAGIRLVPLVDSGVAAVSAEPEIGKSLTESEAKVDTSKETDDKTDEVAQSESKMDEPEAEPKDKIDSKEAPKETPFTGDKDVECEKPDDETKRDPESEGTGKEVIKEPEIQNVIKDPESEGTGKEVIKGPEIQNVIKDPGPENTEKNVIKEPDVQKVLKDPESENTDKEFVKESELEKVKTVEEKDDDNGNLEKGGEAASFHSFQQLSSSQNAFTGLAGTGLSNSPFSFGSFSKEGATLGSGSPFGQSSFGFGLSNNGNSSLFGGSGTSTVTKGEGSGLPSMQEVPVETGEENEKADFTADSIMFEFLDGSWKERGKGALKVNVPTTGTGRARLIMRTRGNYRLILNASLFPDMKLTNMDKKGITFACVNSIDEGKDGLSTFALKFKDASIVEEFLACVMKHKDKKAIDLKTPENSPKASDD